MEADGGIYERGFRCFGIRLMVDTFDRGQLVPVSFVEGEGQRATHEGHRSSRSREHDESTNHRDSISDLAQLIEHSPLPSYLISLEIQILPEVLNVGPSAATRSSSPSPCSQGFVDNDLIRTKI